MRVTSCVLRWRRTELDLALRHPRSAAELRQAIASAAEEADRLSRIAADLLTVAQAEQADLGGLPLRVRPVDAREVVHEAARPFRAKAASLGRALVVEPGPDVVVAADPARLRQALHNLLDNAFEHGAGTVSLGVVGAADTVEFHVTDEGGGFPEGFLPRAFSRFSRADASGRTQGAGLGLSIVAAVAHGHGGVAHAANRPGAGADVSISLPVRSAAARHEDAPMPR
jgi:two-component system OmpR family sensor kinase